MNTRDIINKSKWLILLLFVFGYTITYERFSYAENDYFRAIVSFEYDHLCQDWNYEPIVYDANATDDLSPTIFNFRTVLNDSTRVHIVKRKNGVIEVVKDTTLVLTNPIYDMSFYF